MADSVTPLCTAGQLTEGPFKDLFSYFGEQAIADMLTEATRICESETGRRLAPFGPVTESHRGEGMDPDEYTDSANLPMDLQGSLGRSYAYALGASTLVRHCWLNEYAVRNADMWTYSITQFKLVRSYGGSELLSPSQYTGPDPDSGHIWLNLGIFAPIGSYFYVTYGGGYTVAVPADLSRANKLIAAHLACRELAPETTNHDPNVLYEDAMKILCNYERA